MNIYRAKWVFLLLIVALLMALPLAAQSDDQQELFVVEGVYTVAADGTIIVGGYIIAPANAFLPPDISEGDMVLVTGYLLPDDVTVQALSIEIEEDALTVDGDRNLTSNAETENVTTDTNTSGNRQGNGQGNGNANDGDRGNGQGNNGQGNGNANDGDGGRPDCRGNSCNAPGRGGNGNGAGNGQGNSPEHGFYCEHTENQHPAAERLAAEFAVPYSEVITLFCDDEHGIGEILIAYRLAAVSGQSVQALFALRDGGEGWGNIFGDMDINPGEVMGNRHHPGNGHGNGNNLGMNPVLPI